MGSLLHVKINEAVLQICLSVLVPMARRSSVNGSATHQPWAVCTVSIAGYSVPRQSRSLHSRLVLVSVTQWKHAYERISAHEQSRGHMCAVTESVKIGCRVDQSLQKEIDEQTSYWENVIKRLVSVITFLAERGLAFRGNDQIIGSPHNGNYLGLLELASEYDPFLAVHIQIFDSIGLDINDCRG